MSSAACRAGRVRPAHLHPAAGRSTSRVEVDLLHVAPSVSPDRAAVRMVKASALAAAPGVSAEPRHEGGHVGVGHRRVVAARADFLGFGSIWSSRPSSAPGWAGPGRCARRPGRRQDGLDPGPQREAVSGVRSRSAPAPCRTALASTWSTGVSRMGAQYLVSVMRHCSACLALREAPRATAT